MGSLKASFKAGHATDWLAPVSVDLLGSLPPASWQAAELLIDSGADVNAIENEGKTHLDWLILSGETTGAALLRSYGALTYQELESQKGM